MGTSPHDFAIASICYATYSGFTQTLWAADYAWSLSREAVMWNKSQSEVPGTSTPLQEIRISGVQYSSPISVRSSPQPAAWRAWDSSREKT
jgi:hypothetical protein